MEPKSSEPLYQQVDDETVQYNKEFEDLLSSLPKERSLVTSYKYQYQGFWYSPPLLQGVINCQKHFKPRENDIFIVTAPKSGTTWMKAILYALINREAHPPQTLHHPLLNKAPRDLVPFLEFLSPSEYDSVCNSPDRRMRIFATHIPVVNLPKSITASLSNCRVVYMCRDIKDNFVSLFHFANKANLRPSPVSLEDAFNSYCKGVSAAGPVWDQVLGYWIESQKKPQKVLFMRYEEMKVEPKLQLRRLANFLGMPFSLEEENSGLVDQIISLCSFESMTKVDVNKTGNFVDGFTNSSFFRKGLVGDWKNCLTADMAAKLDQITEEKFRGSGLYL
ncbi:Sulfotransferase [Heracleum sosnowskyi]|uniref:Sulfotransferase n=1 Tax=Heracleum sosnowskyi TaxID=360622 RepID=A0AAD8IKL4_9APIA|nr:Sulfotransferase [Heracleum sosnowskyi]